MDFLRRLFGIGAAAPRAGQDGAGWITVQCLRCAEVIRARINLANDLSAEYDQASGATTYVCRKLLIGNARCFQPIEVRLRFDANRNPIDRQITGGKFLEAQEEGPA